MEPVPLCKGEIIVHIQEREQLESLKQDCRAAAVLVDDAADGIRLAVAAAVGEGLIGGAQLEGSHARGEAAEGEREVIVLRLKGYAHV